MGSVASHHLVCTHTTEDGEVSGSESELPHHEGDIAGEDDNAKEDKGRAETSSNGQVASDGEEGQECPHTHTPSPALTRSSIDRDLQALLTYSEYQT